MEALLTAASIMGPLIGLLGVAAGFLYYRKSRKYMELTYEVHPALSLVQVGSAVKQKVNVEYDGEPIEDLSGVSVEIRNSVTEFVEFDRHAGTLETPVTLDFGEDARILGEPSVELTPKDLQATAIKDPGDPSRVILDKFLLNSGQSVTVTTLLTNYSGGSPEVYAQIKGLPPLRGRLQVEADRARAQMRARIAYALIATLITIVVGTFVYLLIVSSNTGTGELSTDELIAVLQTVGITILTPLVGLIGAVIGFYYGGQTAIQAASQNPPADR